MTGSRLLFPWMAAVAVRLCIGAAAHAPTVLSDEVEYFLAARPPAGHPGALHSRYPPLYPLCISGVAQKGGPETGYVASKVLNAFLSSTVVPLTWPLWGSAGPVAGLAVGLLAPGVIVSGLVLSENLFTPILCLWLLAVACWRRSDGLIPGALVALTTIAAVLTRAAGGALVLAVLAIAGSNLARRPRRALVPIALTVIPVVVFVMVRMNLTTEQFNDPLASEHISEISRGTMASRDNLTAGTILEPVAQPLPFSWVFMPFWFLYWGIQYGLYLLLGAAYVPLVFLDARARQLPQARRFLLPLLAATMFLILLSANHNLAGWQGEQFVRGRYVEPLIPIWLALSMSCIVMPGSLRISRWKLLPFAFLGIVGMTSAQNRSADLLYPLRSLFLSLRPDTRLCAGILFAVVFVFLIQYWLEAARQRHWLIRGMVAFVLCTGTASVLRFMRHVETASGDAAIAHWLSDNAPSATIEIDTGGATTDSLKTTGLTWVVQQIRFFSPTNTLTLSGTKTESPYRLHLGYSEKAKLCAHHRSGGTDHVICLSEEGGAPDGS